MDRYVEEFGALVTVEQQLLTASTAIRIAGLRLSGEGPLRDELRELLRMLEAAVDHTRRTKRLLLADWRAAGVAQPAA